MKIYSTAIAGVVIAETASHTDPRGAFTRFFCATELATVLGKRHVVQINHSRTHAAGAVRGLHYQRSPRAEMKLVRCIRGRVWDVAVDLRAGSPTRLQWHAEELRADNHRMLVIPEGCAHGFQALEADSELLYLHTEFYAPDFEGGIAPTDPTLAIRWPLPIQDLSERDRNLPRLEAGFTGLTA